MNGLYVHIPFCVSKCVYCDFLSFKAESRDVMRRYTDALVNEIDFIREKNVTFDTVYMGGGTPTALPSPFLLEIIKAVNRLDLTPGAEFTVETNPGTLDEEHASRRIRSEPSSAETGASGGNGGADFLAALKNAGVNRLSIGLQAWQDALLKSLGRIHTQKEFISACGAAADAGIANVSVDVMFSLPGQTMKMWEETLTEVLRFKPKHISAYSLTPEEGTPLWGMIKRGEAVLPGDETDREMYHTARKILSAAGYVHYELSNFALPGYESRHNTRYWKRRPYWGAGLGAHSFDGAARWRNTYDLKNYLSLNAASVYGTSAAEDMEIITEREAWSEEMFLGLRMTEGVPFNSFFAKETDELIQRGLLARHGDTIALTELGMDLANQVFVMF